MKITFIILQTILSLIGWFRPTKLNYIWTSVVVIFVVIASLAQLKIELNQINDAKKDSYTGILFLNNKSGIPKHLQIGGSNFTGKINLGTKPFDLLDFIGTFDSLNKSEIRKTNSFQLSTEHGRLVVSAKIHSSDGSLVGEIVRNEWKVNPQQSFDRNYSDNALEIRDKNGEVVLQIILLSDRLCFQAKLWDSMGNGVAIIDNPDDHGCLFEFSYKGEGFKNSIKPYFNYPSTNHLGEKQAL